MRGFDRDLIRGGHYGQRPLCAALTGRTHGCTDQPANMKKTLANSEPSTHGRGFNRSRQHLLILLDWEVSDGGECTDVVHAETAGSALGAMEERSMCGGHRPSA